MGTLSVCCTESLEEALRSVRNTVAEAFVVERGAVRLSRKIFKIVDTLHGVEGIANYEFIRKPIAADGRHKPGEYIIVAKMR